jgi:uncharacterized membrane protein required for colicin V production
MRLESLPVNWFDLAALAVLVTGFIVGRKKGISEELLPVFQWLTILVVAALYYEPVGGFIARYTQIKLLFAYLAGYLLLVVLIRVLFGWIKRLVGEKLVAGDIFGRAEYYLGMAAGGLRFFCILVLLLSLLHAKYISPDQLAAEARMQRENFGSISFPTLGILQQTVFNDSLTGRFVIKYLGDQLIASTPADRRYVEREGLGRRRERAVEEVLGTKQ